MSNENHLRRLTPLLTEAGGQHLFGFFDEIDAPTAAWFRDWLGAAGETEIKEVADLLNHSVGRREFAGWWRVRDKVVETPATPTHSPPPGSSQLHRPQREFASVASRKGSGLQPIPLIVLGIVLMFAARTLSTIVEGASLFAVLLSLVGLLVYLAGCMKYAARKGHSVWIGLLGLLTCLGLPILLLLPDRNRRVR